MRGLERRREQRKELAGELAHEDGLVVRTEFEDDVVQREALDEHRAARVHLADPLEELEQVEADVRLAVVDLLDDALEELRLGDTDRDGRGDAAELVERIEQVLEGVGLGVDEAP